MRTKKELTIEQKAQKAEYAKKWRKNNPEKVSEHARRVRVKNKEKIKIRQKEWSDKNKKYVQEKGKIWYENNKNRSRNVYLKRVFGITLEEYNNLMVKQNNCCAICGEPPVIGEKSFPVDHDHETGKVRGLLCRGCNVGIGNLKDSVELLEKAIMYIKKFREDI
jgi:hypothetical protein